MPGILYWVLGGIDMSLGVRFARLPRPLTNRLLPALRHFNLMRALELRLMEPWVQHVAGWRVLDVGCGHGLYSLDLARRDAILIGCDLQRLALADARRTARGLGLSGRALFLAADGAALPFPRQHFDLIVCNCVLEHIVDDNAALAAMARALRPGGLLYLSVDNADHGLTLGFLERARWLLRPEVAAAPTIAEGLDERLDHLYAVLRRYRRDDLALTLSTLDLTVLDSRPYLTGAGAAHYEAFHVLRSLDPNRGLGRLLYMLSSLILYPLAAWSDNRDKAQGHGLAIVARKNGGNDR
jgi:SAM-dependent methyltransferase